MPCVTATIQGPEEQNGGGPDPEPEPDPGQGGGAIDQIINQIKNNPGLAAAGVGAGALAIGALTRED